MCFWDYLSEHGVASAVIRQLARGHASFTPVRDEKGQRFVILEKHLEKLSTMSIRCGQAR